MIVWSIYALAKAIGRSLVWLHDVMRRIFICHVISLALYQVVQYIDHGFVNILHTSLVVVGSCLSLVAHWLIVPRFPKLGSSWSRAFVSSVIGAAFFAVLMALSVLAMVWVQVNLR